MKIQANCVIREKREALKKILQILSKSNRPFVIYKAHMYDTLKSEITNLSSGFTRNSFSFCFNDIEAGKDVGKYLTLLGHRSVVCLSYSKDQWFLNRLLGLKRGFAKILNADFKITEMWPSTIDLSAKVQMPYKDEAAKQLLMHEISKIYGGYKFMQLDPAMELHSKIYSLIKEDISQMKLKPFFEKALEQKDITAWVCADNWVSSAAINFLARKGIEVPGQISIIGMDDDENAQLHGITSHDFQIGQMGYLAAHCILGDIPIKRNQKGIVECPGRIIERGSVKRCK